MSVNIFGEFLHHPWDKTCQAVRDLTHHKNPNVTKEGFHACVDVSHFKPSEVTVKTVDNTVVIEAKHDERDDGHGPIQRRLVRKYNLPEDCDVQTLKSTLSEGVLTIKAPVSTVTPGEEKHVPIAHTDVPIHLSDRQFEDPLYYLSMIAWPEY